MTVNSTLMKAILSMDAYNRGYGAGINLSGNLLGKVSIAKTIVDGIEVNLDSSAIFRDPTTHALLDEHIGFYGIAYQLPGGEKVISYRGTDNLNVLTG
ncbi:MAG: hypothetical protein JNN09_03165, partial [Alphaproteobacteria bacterium]|nr:hypothetical protein [Alphaproteobacteria bacterium]